MRRGLMGMAAAALIVLMPGCGSEPIPEDGPTQTVAPEDLSPEAQKGYERVQKQAIEDANKGKVPGY